MRSKQNYLKRKANNSLLISQNSRSVTKKNQPVRRTGQGGSVQSTFQGESFSGPLPHPDLLLKYNNAVADAAERILRMAETQATHRQDIEKRVIKSNTLNQTLGTIFGFIIASAVIAGGIYLISLGASITGFVAIVSALGSLVTVFVKGRSAQDRERREKLQGLGRQQ